MNEAVFQPESGILLQDESLKKHTTYRIGGNARYFFQPDSMDSLMEALEWCRENDVDWFVLGNGSNVLIEDKPYPGMVIQFGPRFSGWSVSDDGLLEAEAGCSLIALSHLMMDRGWSGLEFAGGIPGSLGGGLFMNAGAYKKSLSDLVREIEVLIDGNPVWMKPEELEYAYRSSVFQKNRDWVITRARLQLEKKDTEEIRKLMESRRERREATQPVKAACAGSVFRNPEGQNAWKIVDDLGYRGSRRGGAKVSDKHSNFIVNEDGTATFQDVSSLIDEIRNRALIEYGIDLHPEVERILWSEEEEDKG